MIDRGKQQYPHSPAATSKHLGCSPATTSQQAHATQGYLFSASQNAELFQPDLNLCKHSVVLIEQAQHAEIMDGNSQSAHATNSFSPPLSPHLHSFSPI
jgi:hypothetical protein